jgi:hypothetical protein
VAIAPLTFKLGTTALCIKKKNKKENTEKYVTHVESKGFHNFFHG